MRSNTNNDLTCPSRLALGCFGGFGLLIAAAPDRNLLVSVLPSHVLLLRQLPLLPRQMLLSTGT